jgi:hypothetical protein
MRSMQINIIKKISYFYNENIFLFYLEFNKFYFYSKTSSRKLKSKFYFLYLVNKNEIIELVPLFASNDKRYNHWWYNYNYLLSESKKRKLFKQSFYENKGRIKIVGRGWKIIRYSYLQLIKLGYSHIIYNVFLPIYKDKFKKKKKKYYTYYSLFYTSVNTLLSRFKLMRVPDVYTRKGIFHRKVIL